MSLTLVVARDRAAQLGPPVNPGQGPRAWAEPEHVWPSWAFLGLASAAPVEGEEVGEVAEQKVRVSLCCDTCSLYC